uniref:Uncharacterized protein n=1 Tax=Ananas comosus var. bracteatus TaxID=296719 RepID=A0A6V7P537_ANACO|nr:unnamed protein product [Ananas comosus var. bracteatus]
MRAPPSSQNPLCSLFQTKPPPLLQPAPPSPAPSFARATLARPFLRPRHPRPALPLPAPPSLRPPSPAPFFGRATLARAFLRPRLPSPASSHVKLPLPLRCNWNISLLDVDQCYFRCGVLGSIPSPFVALKRPPRLLCLSWTPWCHSAKVNVEASVAEAARLLYLSASPTAIKKISLHLISGLGLLYKFGLLSIQGNDGQSKNYEAQVINCNRASTATRKDVGFQPQKPFLRSQSKKSEPIPPSSEDPHVSQCPPSARIDQPASPNAANPDVNSTGPRCLHLGKLIVYILV